MKKLLLLGALLLLSTLSFSQTNIDTLSISTKTLEWFKNVYVKENFKDPYSYQLMNYKTKIVTNREWVQTDLDFCIKYINEYNTKKRHTDFEKEKFERLTNNKIKYENELLQPNVDEIRCIKIYIDARGSNSYGGLVLNKYEIRLFKKDNFENPTVFKI